MCGSLQKNLWYALWRVKYHGLDCLAESACNALFGVLRPGLIQSIPLHCKGSIKNAFKKCAPSALVENRQHFENYIFRKASPPLVAQKKSFLCANVG